MLCVVGAGNMGRALAGGLAASGHDVCLVERHVDRHQALAIRAPGVKIATAPVECDGAFIAVKPKDVEVAVRQAVDGGAKRIVSLATAVDIAQIRAVASALPVARAMPNIGALERKSATSVAANDDAMAEWTMEAMRSVGVAVRVDESQLHATTALAGSGPAYVFLVAEAMTEAGIAAGLAPDVAAELANATIDGAGALLVSGHATASQLRAQVSTPGGTTIEGLRVLEENRLRSMFLDAVAAAASRSRELTGQALR